MIELQLLTGRGVRAGKVMQTLHMNIPTESLVNGTLDTSTLKQQLLSKFAEARQGDKAKLMAAIKHPRCSSTSESVISGKGDAQTQPVSSRFAESAKTRNLKRLRDLNSKGTNTLIPRSYTGAFLERSISVLNQNACNYIKQRVAVLYDVAKQAVPTESPMILDESSEALIASKGLDNAKAYMAFRLLNQSSERNELGDLLSFNLPKLDKSLQLMTIAELKYVAQKFDAVLLRFLRQTRRFEIQRQRTLPFREQLSCKELTAKRSLAVFIREYVAARVSRMLFKQEQRKQAKAVPPHPIQPVLNKQPPIAGEREVASAKSKSTQLLRPVVKENVNKVAETKAIPTVKEKLAKITEPRARSSRARSAASKTKGGRETESAESRKKSSVKTASKRGNGST